MPFWTSALSEPRRSHRFIVTLPNLTSKNGEFSYQQYLAKSVTKPSYQVTATEHKFLGNTFYYPGIVTWGTVGLTIVNAVNPDGNQILMDALAGSGYLKPDVQEDVFFNPGQNPSTVNKQGAVDVIGDVVIQELNGAGGNIGEWRLMNSFLTDAKFGDLNYDNDNFLNIEMTFRYDWAEYVSGPDTSAATSPNARAN